MNKHKKAHELVLEQTLCPSTLLHLRLGDVAQEKGKSHQPELWPGAQDGSEDAGQTVDSFPETNNTPQTSGCCFSSSHRF